MVFKIFGKADEAKRIKEILEVLFDEGLGFLITHSKLAARVSITKRLRARLAKEKETPLEARVRSTLERLGPTFIKLGQMLSIRPDLVPKRYIHELEKLQDNVSTFPYSEVKSIIESEFQKPISKIFRVFEKEPIASASISQVHRAKLPNGRSVAVKVQRPGVKDVMMLDIKIMSNFLSILEKYNPAIKEFNHAKVIEEFTNWTKKELDFRTEARNAHAFFENFKESKTVKIPWIYDELTTEKILTTEFINGIQLNRVEDIRRKKYNFDRIISNGLDAILKQVFVYGTFHGDPHPGNILVLPDSTVAFVDFGIVGYFDDELKNKSIDLLQGVLTKDIELISDTLSELGSFEEKATDMSSFKSELKQAIEPLQWSSLRNVQISRILEEVLDIALRYKIRIPMPFVLFGKSIVTIEGIALQYDPNFQAVERIKPFLRNLALERTHPKFWVKDIARSAARMRRFIFNLPVKTDNVLDRLQKGTIKIDLNETDIKKLSIEIDRSSNRIAYALIISSLVVSASFIWQIERTGSNHIISLVLLSVAAFFGLALITSIIKEGRLK